MYRNGEWKAATAALNRAVESRREAPERHTHDEYFWLAMAHWKLGDKEQARACYDKGAEYFWQYGSRDPVRARVHAEAAELLSVPGTNRKDKQKSGPKK